jgi:Domain of unknown function (DUF427)
MGLSRHQGPLAPGSIGRFLVPGLLPERLLYAEPLRRGMRVRFAGGWIADSADAVLLYEPGRYPAAYFPLGDITPACWSPASTAPGTARTAPNQDAPQRIACHPEPAPRPESSPESPAGTSNRRAESPASGHPGEIRIAP